MQKLLEHHPSTLNRFRMSPHLWVTKMFFFSQDETPHFIGNRNPENKGTPRPTSPPTILGTGATSAVESSPGRPATAAVRQPDDHDGTRGVGCWDRVGSDKPWGKLDKNIYDKSNCMADFMFFFWGVRWCWKQLLVVIFCFFLCGRIESCGESRPEIWATSIGEWTSQSWDSLPHETWWAPVSYPNRHGVKSQEPI